jgi:hypothetical protein
MGFGIPTTEETFRANLLNAEKDFAKRFNGIWPRYQQQFIAHLTDAREEMKKAGLNVEYELTLKKFQMCFQETKYRVIILFSHWKQDHIEFADGLTGIDSIIEAVPVNFDGLIDLCVCHPKRLAIELRAQRPNCLVKFIDKRATPSFWLAFYSVLFRHLHSSQMSYPNAMMDVISEFKKISNEYRGSI